MLRISKRRAREARPAPVPRGFTLVELMITLVVLALVAVSLSAVLMTASRSKTSSSNQVESAQAARSAIDMIASDLRSAGYGADIDYVASPQPPIAYIDSTQVVINANLQPYPDGTAPRQPPQAYQPAGNPKPKPLDGTSWQPPIKYRTGAEVIHYTLDVNNDGVVDANDISGSDAARTRNPDDYLLVRTVYGDSVGFLAGNNGPASAEAVALVRKPGGGVSPLFTVYMRGQSTPWNWSSGPVPASQLKDIDRIVVNVNAPSGKPDSRGNYSETRLTTQVQTARNVPDWGEQTYSVSGYVYKDVNTNHVKDAGEPGISGVSVRVGSSFTGITNSTGQFVIYATTGTYTLRHTPLANYGAFDSPDTFVITIPPPKTQSFADTARSGGWANVTVYDDANNSGTKDAGEDGVGGVKLTLLPPSTDSYTSALGTASIFVQTGGYAISCTPPDSYVVTTTNPVVNSMTNGGSKTHSFGLRKSAVGVVRGKVYRDDNKNGAWDGTESGMQNVWVAVVASDGVTVEGYAYTNASGDYLIQAPANDPPGTSPYFVKVMVPNGFFATTSTWLGPHLLSDGENITSQDFGVVAYQVITLNASRVLSLINSDFCEDDFINSNKPDTRRMDTDLILGADAGGTDNVSVWFNLYDRTPLYAASPTPPDGYTRNAANSVLSLAADTLDTNGGAGNLPRPDLVTGTKTSASGNLFVWFNQNSKSNYGYLPSTPDRSYRTNDNGDVQSVLITDCAGGLGLDILVGTKSPTAGNGTVEVWVSNDQGNPAFTSDEIYPPAGNIPGGRMGEVAAMALADFDGDGKRDLVVGTRTGTYSGELLVFRRYTKNAGLRYICEATYSLPTAAVTSLTVLDVNGDGYLDVVAGTQTSSSSGTLQFWRNDNSSPLMSFSMQKEVNAPGIVTALASADLGGTSRSDVAMGWRQSETGYGGGVLIYNSDSGTLQDSGVDPSAGAIVNMVPALTTANFNYGVLPALPPPPYLTDLAVGVKSSATTGALVVFIR